MDNLSMIDIIKTTILIKKRRQAALAFFYIIPRI